MFSKEKGTTWKLTNGILLVSLIGYIISLLVMIITELLPENGDYSNFVFNDFMYEFLYNLSIIAIIGLTLLIINKKFNFFDKSYPFSRKFLNLCIIFAIIGTIIYVISDTLGILFNPTNSILYIGSELKNNIASTLVYISILYFVNFKPIMIKENGKLQNLFNFICIWFCIESFETFVLSFLNVSSFNHPVDFFRTIIIEIIIFSILAFVIYLVNFKKKDHETEIPQAFNNNN